jgi:hypothetical protein
MLFLRQLKLTAKDAEMLTSFITSKESGFW